EGNFLKKVSLKLPSKTFSYPWEGDPPLVQISSPGGPPPRNNSHKSLERGFGGKPFFRKFFHQAL
ncbi:MAG TPA: hypothetical protein VJM57_00655, partial [Thermodesulfobacteriota bacterium]|nr:hypothetical protein [Thermodesulfobacteriota bacterium]